MTTANDAHNAQYEAYLKLGPYCPKCKELAQGFYIDFNPIRGLFMGKVDCNKQCKKTHRMIYVDNEWKFDEDRTIVRRKRGNGDIKIEEG